jgi:hypothetical protein
MRFQVHMITEKRPRWISVAYLFGLDYCCMGFRNTTAV